jgi:hypothetical protein
MRDDEQQTRCARRARSRSAGWPCTLLQPTAVDTDAGADVNSQRLRTVYGRQCHGRRMAHARRRRKLQLRDALAAKSAVRDYAAARSGSAIYRYALARRYLGACVSARPRHLPLYDL